MEVFGIEFAPLNTPMHRRLQTLSAFLVLILFPLWSTIGIIITGYILFYTRFWFISVLYFLWVYVIDKDTPEQGGRRSEYFCDLKIYKYARDYYPANLVLEKGLVLDAKRNYLFCSFPHGVMSSGPFLTILTNAANFNEFFPYHRVNGVTLDINFKVPVFRDLLLLSGSCNSSAKSINYLLSYPEGGRIAVLVVGGAEEGFYARPGPYQLILKNRKGFVKLALKNGSPLVPVFSFGEIELFDQINNPKGSLLRTIQDKIKRITGIAPILIFGRGFLQYTFGPVPRRTPLTVVVGKPIDVQKNENPTQEDIDALHAKFIEELTRLFEANKHNYIKNPEHATLVVC